ncbi:unnamed protein product [Cuscuta europaea]|uniref:Retroviral polymerase SH3-like domain-containing protein n=1 Tax=Cuscuta europaea TaxID=41803 RepID=A0A9P1E7M9_CUSEU|nr:unnamed protein product [Cuscuta europaea]
MPSKVLGFKTPISILQECYPTTRLISSLPLKIFDCTVFIKNPDKTASKFDPRGTKCVFLGIPSTQKGYKCFDPSTKRMFISMDSVFVETQPFFDYHLQGENLNEDANNVSHIHENLDFLDISLDMHPIRNLDALENSQKSGNNETNTTDKWEKKDNRLVNSLARFMREEFQIKEKRKSLNLHLLMNLTQCQYMKEEALSKPEWKKAVWEEMDALEKNQTWKIVELPRNKPIVGCRWIFTPKFKADGTLERYKLI